jgi:uncharacterized protein YdeI (YjbR/CyaY-like superfamily)
MTEHKGLAIVAFETRADWAAWLAGHGADVAGVWLKLAKKTAGAPSVTKAEAIEAALAQGWVDGQLDRFDDRFWLVRFTPRGPGASGRRSIAPPRRR